jgi:hypothetical protein
MGRIGGLSMAGLPIAGDTAMPLVLSRQIQQANASGYKLDITIDGIPFLLNPTEKDPWTWEVREDRREQFDNSQEAGEQSFGYFWLRSQSSFHAGAGQEFLDSGTEVQEVSRIRYNTSTQMDVFSKVGSITPRGGVTGTAIANIARAVPFVRSGVNKIAVARSNNDSVDFYNVSPALAFDVNVSLTEAASLVQDIATDGETLYVAVNGKIIKIDSAGVQTDWATLAFTKAVRLAYTKNRLILAHGPELYEIPISAAPGALVFGTHGIFRHGAPNWTWSSVAEGPNGIYAAGYSGLRGEVWSFTETEVSGTLELGAGTQQFSLPTGEIPYDLFFYVNSLFVLGTSEGARVGSFTPDGRPQFGPLSFDLSPVRAIGAVGTTAILGSDLGVYLLDLGRVVDRNGAYAYAHRHDRLAAEPYVSIVTTGSVGAPSIYSVTTGRIEAEAANSSGSLTTSWTTFSTTELKKLYYLSIGGRIPEAGAFLNDTVVITVENYEGDIQTFNVGADPSKTNWEFTISLNPSIAYRVKFQINTGTDVNYINSYQLKALPQERRYESVVLPLLLADSEIVANGRRRIGYPGFGMDRLKAIMQTAKNNRTVVVRDNVSNSSIQAQIRDIQFRQEHGIAEAPGRKVTAMVNVVLRVVT